MVEALLSSLARTVHLCALAHVSVHISSCFIRVSMCTCSDVPL